jgi:XTP/dITP diphosphohydrolase
MLLVLGTANRKKGIELARLLAPAGRELGTLADYPAATPVPEDAETFAENARLKAAGYARQIGQWVAADDSGLVVDALGGAPGVYSARYAGPNATDEANNDRLFEELRDVPLDRRGAQFVCHMAVADPSGEIRAESEGACRGRILFALNGSEGFGYDPLFEIVEYHRTFGQLSSLVKSWLSHRSRAAARLVPKLAAM